LTHPENNLKNKSRIFDAEYLKNGFFVQALSRPITSAGRVKMSKLPAAKIVRTTYRGGYEGLGAAWAEFCQWIEAEGLNVQDSLWECYLSGPESSPDPDKWRTELNRPLTL